MLAVNQCRDQSAALAACSSPDHPKSQLSSVSVDRSWKKTFGDGSPSILRKTSWSCSQTQNRHKSGMGSCTTSSTAAMDLESNTWCPLIRFRSRTTPRWLQSLARSHPAVQKNRSKSYLTHVTDPPNQLIEWLTPFNTAEMHPFSNPASWTLMHGTKPRLPHIPDRPPGHTIQTAKKAKKRAKACGPYAFNPMLQELHQDEGAALLEICVIISSGLKPFPSLGLAFL